MINLMSCSTSSGTSPTTPTTNAAILQVLILILLLTSIVRSSTPSAMFCEDRWGPNCWLSVWGETADIRYQDVPRAFLQLLQHRIVSSPCLSYAVRRWDKWGGPSYITKVRESGQASYTAAPMLECMCLKGDASLKRAFFERQWTLGEDSSFSDQSLVVQDDIV